MIWPFCATNSSFDCLPNAIVDTYGRIISANKSFYDYFNCRDGMKIREIMQIRSINQRVLCATDFHQWEMLYESVNENYKVWMVGTMPLEPTIWNIIQIPMLVCKENGQIIAINNACSLEFVEVKKQHISAFCILTEDLSHCGYIETTINSKRYKANSLKYRNNWLVIFEQYSNAEAIASIASSVVHDFRNWLMIIEGYAEMAKTNTAYIANIQNTIANSHKMINHLMDFINDKSKFEIINIIDALNNISCTLKLLANIPLSLKININMGYIALSYSQLEQILCNLVKNAYEAKCTQISISVKQKYFAKNWSINGCKLKIGMHIEISITDNGQGIDQIMQKALFRKKTTKDTGSGIGLNSARQILNTVCGGIVISSNQKIGTRVKLYIPLVQAKPGSIANEQSSVQPNLKTVKKILLVEDNEDIRGIFSSFLKKNNYEVKDFKNTEEAMEYFNVDSKIDLVITDANLPGNSGAFLANKIRQDLPNVKIIVISGMEKDVILPLFPSDVAFLCKPISLAKLLEKVQAL